MGLAKKMLPFIVTFKSRSETLRSKGIVVQCVLCCFVVCQGLFVLIQYKTTPGKIGTTTSTWPKASLLSPNEKLPTLVLFAHPRCPCTRATIEELDLLMTHSQGKVATHVLFYTPDSASDDWSQTDVWRATERIPGVVVHQDIDGIESQRFGAETSGFSVLYDRNGHLIYRGGITGSRGHVGNNIGRAAIHSLLEGEASDCKEFYVFGCSLLDQPSQNQESSC